MGPIYPGSFNVLSRTRKHKRDKAHTETLTFLFLPVFVPLYPSEISWLCSYKHPDPISCSPKPNKGLIIRIFNLLLRTLPFFLSWHSSFHRRENWKSSKRYKQNFKQFELKKQFSSVLNIIETKKWHSIFINSSFLRRAVQLANFNNSNFHFTLLKAL